jgi:N utilization substance protein B
MPKVTRRDIREWILQLLFQIDINPQNNLEFVFANFWIDKSPTASQKKFVEKFVKLVLTNLATIDKIIASYAENWNLHRMGTVERNVLRMAIFEMVHSPSVPHVVVINEAVDIAKYFSTNMAGRFVNGILEKVRQDFPAIKQLFEKPAEQKIIAKNDAG